MLKTKSRITSDGERIMANISYNPSLITHHVLDHLPLHSVHTPLPAPSN